MGKALGAITGIIIIVVGFVCLILATLLAGLGFQTQPILILGLILTLIGFVLVIIAIIVYLCYQSPILVIPRG
ncbi:MAG: hypothetical protein Q6364_07300 [Candidatus Hermodarchaeota archaeon]|nr:hypothetical protein [Candidatus Hermodarchaeota archaeon]